VDRARLDRIVANYNTELAETPLCIGHPKADDPAFGWVEKFRRVGDILQALPSKILPEFRDAVNQGLYKYVSAKIRPNDTIAHIGFLGAAAPAVSGLGAVTLSEEDAGITVELSSDTWLEKSLFRRVIGFFQKLRDAQIEEGGVDEADKVITADDIASFTRDIENLEDCPDQVTSPSTTLSEEGSVDPKELKRLLDAANADLATANSKNVELSAALTKATGELATVKTEFSSLQKKVADDAAAAVTAELSEYCDEAVKQGKLKAGDKKPTLALMELAVRGGEIELTEGDKTTKKSALDYLKALIAAKKPSVTFSEVATSDKVGHATDLSEAEGLSREIITYVAEQKNLGNNVTYPAALQHVKNSRT
jgi:hypothetical protein